MYRETTKKNRIIERAGGHEWLDNISDSFAFLEFQEREASCVVLCLLSGSISLFCLCSSNPQLIQSVLPRPLSFHSNACSCAYIIACWMMCTSLLNWLICKGPKLWYSIICMWRVQRWEQSSLPCSSSFDAFLDTSTSRNGCQRSTRTCVP